MPGFGDTAVKYNEDPAAATGAAPVNGEARKPVEDIDINDPRLTSEELNVNTEGDAFAMPAPPPEGMKLRASIKILKPKNAKGEEVDFIAKNHETKGLYLATGVEATIIDQTGKYDKLKVYDRWVATLLQRDNATKIQTILSKLARPDGRPWVLKDEKMTHKAWMDRFVQALSGEPEIGFEPSWEWSCESCGKEAKEKGVDYPRSIIGMRKFPVRVVAGKTVHDPEMKCEAKAAHGYSRAQIRIGEVCKASEVK